MFEHIDAHLENSDGETAYTELKKLYDSDQAHKKDVEVLWRLARACHIQASGLESKNPRKKELIVEGQGYAKEAVKLDGKHFLALKWAAVTTGSLTEHLGTKEKIQEGYVFKDFLDRALAMDAKESSLLHMRGRFAFSVASLSWMERKLAATFFATPPTATFDEAIADFLEVEKLRPAQWIDNLLYLARSYVAKGDKAAAVPHLRTAEKIEPADDADRESLREVAALLQKYGK
ncbi:Protein RMD-2 c [Aphelenchoides avenae]|nr:Protein RMD-2 c [Aphelenchus avenae]